jgi:hypothetical protein
VKESLKAIYFLITCFPPFRPTKKKSLREALTDAQEKLQKVKETTQQKRD